MAGGQGSVSTKTYTCSVAVLMYLAYAIAGHPPGPLTQEVMRAVVAQEKLLERHDSVLMPPIVEFFNRPPYVSLMSRGADLATAYQGALTLKEVARVAAEPISAAQFRHGPMEIISPSHRYILFARQGKTEKLLLKLAKDIRKSNGRVLLFTDTAFDDPMNIRQVLMNRFGWGWGRWLTACYIYNCLASRCRPCGQG